MPESPIERYLRIINDVMKLKLNHIDAQNYIKNKLQKFINVKYDIYLYKALKKIIKNYDSSKVVIVN